MKGFYILLLLCTLPAGGQAQQIQWSSPCVTATFSWKGP